MLPVGAKGAAPATFVAEGLVDSTGHERRSPPCLPSSVPDCSRVDALSTGEGFDGGGLAFAALSESLADFGVGVFLTNLSFDFFFFGTCSFSCRVNEDEELLDLFLRALPPFEISC